MFASFPPFSIPPFHPSLLLLASFFLNCVSLPSFFPLFFSPFLPSLHPYNHPSFVFPSIASPSLPPSVPPFLILFSFPSFLTSFLLFFLQGTLTTFFLSSLSSFFAFLSFPFFVDKRFLLISERTDNDTTSSRDQSCSGDSNNNSGNDYPQQYKEWREMIIAATEGRERSEQETLVCDPHQLCSSWSFKTLTK